MMKKLSLMAGILGVLALLMASPSVAQEQVPPTAPAAPAAPAIPAAPTAPRVYNPRAVVTVTGKVVSVNRRAAKKAGKSPRVTMVLQTDQGAVKVHLGPADYIDQQALKLAPGDRVEVKGVKVNAPKASSFIAGEVRKGDQVLKLRDDATGRPLWFKGNGSDGGT
jgi:hypothetical protein